MSDQAKPKPDLLEGWDWATLLVDVLEAIPNIKFDSDALREHISSELQPLTNRINEQLAERAPQVTLEERVLALERKLATLRLAHQLLIEVALHRAETLRTTGKAGRLTSQKRMTARPEDAGQRAEAVRRLSLRLRMLGQ